MEYLLLQYNCANHGLRSYTAAKDIPLVLGGMGIAVVSTPQGLMTGHDARRHNVGGELLFKVW